MEMNGEITGKEKETLSEKMIFIDNYPDENKGDYIGNITDALAHIGVFDGIKK